MDVRATWLIISAAMLVGAAGCVERELTVNTEPQGALVTLNDEQIGTSPVTVSFNWYGDYKVRIRKAGYETLNTHRRLEGPWYDHFPFDFFAQVVTAKRIEDNYEWNFKLEPAKEPDRSALIERAEQMQEQLNKPAAD